MTRLLRLLPLCLLPACAVLEPTASDSTPPPPSGQPAFVVPAGTEFVSAMFGYSQAVRVGPWVTTSAIPGFDVEKRAFPEDFAEQARLGFELLRTVLEASGASMEDVTEITTYQVDMDQFNAVLNARNEAFGEHRPTWVPIGVNQLLLPTMQFQVSARAYAPLDRASRSSAGVADSEVTPSRTVQKIEPQPEPAGDKAPASESRRPFLNRPGY